MEIINAILLYFAGIIIIFQVFFIKYLQEKNEEFLELAKENLEIAKNLKDKLLKILDENILLQKNIDFLRKNYVPKCSECFKEGFKTIEIMENGKCERCDYENRDKNEK